MMDLIELKKHLDLIESKKLGILKHNVINSDCVYILGNGGSSSIASHLSEDYTKTLKVKSITFSDAARLTCYANDYGYENAYKVWLEEFVTFAINPLVILISSSGNSQNILNCANFCITNNIRYIILTGFSSNNKLKTLCENSATISFHVDSNDYGIVECLHQIILHSII